MPVSKENIENASAPQISMATNKRSAGWREATGIFFYKCDFNISHIQTELSISEPLPAKEHDEAVLRGTICGKYKRNHIFRLPPHQLRMLFVRLGTLFENDPDHRKRDRAGSESSHLYPSSELWDDAERCFCFRRPDPFSAKLVFIIPGWARAGAANDWPRMWISSPYK